MNTYDFDQTIFQPDSSYCFVMFCLKRHPGAVLKALPGVTATGLKLLLKKADTKTLKERIFAFLPALEDVDAEVAAFWRQHRANLEPWYLAQRRPDDLIISASPEFLLRPIAGELGVELIATVMDKHTGQIIGENCHDTAKVRRFRELYGNAAPERFYSDSLSDSPMAEISESAFLVDKGKISPWPGK